MTHFDALVIGAGPAGSTAALMLSRAGWNIAIVEKARFPRRKVCGEFISATSWPLLETLGVAKALRPHAGPPVRRVGLYAGDTVLEAPMPGESHGSALAREHLDTLLLEHAMAAGAKLLDEKPAARIVIEAHGSWHRSGNSRASDLLGFKAHFRNARLPVALMPLVLFSGGYGGMVATSAGLVSFSCCIRRDALEAARRRHPGLSAGDALITHATQSCNGVRETLAGAKREGAWLSAGPIRPGFREPAGDGVLRVGNAAGEAHPIVAEGISMAIQSSVLLAEALMAGREADYPAAWKRNFAGRVRAAALFAKATMIAAPAAVALVRRMPSVLTLGAAWSGKATPLQCRS
jgi:menaquinone-9 beta-reductase